MLTSIGDFRFFWPENITFFTGLPQAWDASLNTGIGKSQINTLWITSYLNFTAFFSQLGLSWNSITYLFWILPSFLIAFLSVCLLFKHLTGLNKYLCILSGVIYSINTYSLLIFFGGQVGVLMAYSLLPLVFLRFIKLFSKTNVINSILAGLIISLQLLFDPRFFYLSLLLLIIYWFFNSLWYKLNFKNIFLWAGLPALIIFLLHSFWILPLVLYRTPSLPDGFSNLSGFKFFSFADFSHAFSLLHPNWPDNIFGKVSFYDPLFMLFPLLAFASLYFITGKKSIVLKSEMTDNFILFFALMLILFSFLAKGANDPFKYMNLFLYEYFPGMSLFRDPTKFYAIIALSYSFLIPYSTFHLLNYVSFKSNTLRIISISVFAAAYLTILGFHLTTGNVNIFKFPAVPEEYKKLKNMIVKEHKFYRTMYVPYWQRYGYFSHLNPAIGRDEIISFSGEPNQMKQLKNQMVIQILKEFGVKYIILPYDSTGEIFIKDRKYDEQIYLAYKKELDSNNQLIKKTNFGKIVVYELKGFKDRFWLESGSGLKWTYISPVEYEIEIENDKIVNRLIFSENYDSNWIAQYNGKVEKSGVFKNRLNSFKIPKQIKKVKIYYKPQIWVNRGLVISVFSVLILTGIIFFTYFKIRI